MATSRAAIFIFQWTLLFQVLIYNGLHINFLKPGIKYFLVFVTVRRVLETDVKFLVFKQFLVHFQLTATAFQLWIVVHQIVEDITVNHRQINALPNQFDQVFSIVDGKIGRLRFVGDPVVQAYGVDVILDDTDGLSDRRAQSHPSRARSATLCPYGDAAKPGHWRNCPAARTALGRLDGLSAAWTVPFIAGFSPPAQGRPEVAPILHSV